MMHRTLPNEMDLIYEYEDFDIFGEPGIGVNFILCATYDSFGHDPLIELENMPEYWDYWQANDDIEITLEV